MDRLVTSLQTTTAAVFTGMMCIDLAFDMPVLQGAGGDEHLLVRRIPSPLHRLMSYVARSIILRLSARIHARSYGRHEPHRHHRCIDGVLSVPARHLASAAVSCYSRFELPHVFSNARTVPANHGQRARLLTS